MDKLLMICDLFGCMPDDLAMGMCVIRRRLERSALPPPRGGGGAASGLWMAASVMLLACALGVGSFVWGGLRQGMMTARHDERRRLQQGDGGGV